MLFATYVPKTNSKENNGAYNELSEYLGYYPIMCFPADNARETVWRSLIADPECPEKFVVFESNDYDTIDIVQWNKRIASMNKNAKDIPTMQSCFTDKSTIYQSYMVKDITNPVVEIDIKEAMSLIPNTDKSEWKSFLAETIKAAQGCAVAICKNVKPGIAPDTPWSEYNHVDHMIIKEGFQGCLLPLLYPIALEKRLSYSTYFDYAKYLRNETTNKIARFFDPESDISNKTYEKYNEILREIRACLMKTYDMQLSDGFNNIYTEIGPNSTCPCGSGKKYKKCCRGLAFDLV